MRSARCSARCAVTDAARLLSCVLLLAAAAPVAAQPALRIGGASAVTVQGTEIDGAPAFSARTLEALGFRLSGVPTELIAVIGTDTLRFWDTSPYFRSGSELHQLAFAARAHAGAMHLPEQFFIQWLPAAYPDRFQYRDGALYAAGGSVRTVAAAPAQPAPANGSAAAPRPERRPTKRIVVIDPGHGGRDPGKVGPNGLREKDVTLLISKRLATVLEERGYEVHLTRTTDTYVSLPDRPRLANEWKGDRPVGVFLSIHANSATASSAHGFETFFLSDARTEDERRVAEMENDAIRFDAHGPSPAADGLDQILNTLRGDFLMRASHDLASAIQENLSAFHPGPNRGVKRAGFYVLVGTIMPAVLIETAFISNRDEARLLGTQSFQQKIARGIADSVDAFFAHNEHLWEPGS